MEPGSALSIGEAEPRDWPAIWGVLREVVSTGDTFMLAPDIDEPTARAAWMGDASAGRVMYVARLDGAVVASAYLKPNLPGLGDHVANAGWMVSAACRGRGVGRRFAEFVIDDARRRGFRAMQFNAVVASNVGAVALWKSMGFEIVGTVPDAFRHRELGLTAVYVMYRKL